VLRLLGFHNFYQLASTTLRQQHELGHLMDFDQTAWLRAQSSRGMRAQRARGDRTAWLGPPVILNSTLNPQCWF
jgi:hypothetical protein